MFWDETWGLTFFARHADVAGILKDRRFGRDPREAIPPGEIDPAVYARTYPSDIPTWTRLVRESFIDLEPPRHTRIRRLVQHAFSKRASESYRSRMEATARTAIATALESGRMELIADYATPIPLTMIAELLGVPVVDQPQLVAWSAAIVRVFDQAVTDDEKQTAERAIVEFADYVSSLVDGHRSDPVDNLTTALVEADVDGDRLSDEELVSTIILTLNAGHEATVQAIGNAVLALVERPEAFAELKVRERVDGRVVDELLRYDTPLQMFERWVLEDVTWSGVDLRRGTKVGLLFGSANRDESVFEEPDGLRFDRHPNPHVSFGAGVHYCVGAPLAKVELEVAMQALVDVVDTIELADTRLERTPSLVFRGVRRLPIQLV